MSESHYFNKEGQRITTSSHHLSRGTCCRCGCLHCPYGTTIERFGIQFYSLDSEYLELARNLIDEESTEGFDVAKMLLSEAYGKSEAFPKLTENNKCNFKLIELKEVPCGVVYFEGDNVSKVFLHSKFRDQGLSKSVIQLEYEKSKQNSLKG